MLRSVVRGCGPARRLTLPQRHAVCSPVQLDNRKKDGPTPQQNIRMFKTMLAKDFERLPWCFETSSRTGAGRTELLGYISSVRQMHEASGGM